MSESVSLTQTEACNRLQNADYPGDDDAQKVHYRAVANIYLDIRRCGHRDPSRLLVHAPSSSSVRPEDGLFGDREVWFDEVAKPVLQSMPDIARPYEYAPEWKFLGDLDYGESSYRSTTSNHRIGYNRSWP